MAEATKVYITFGPRTAAPIDPSADDFSRVLVPDKMQRLRATDTLLLFVTHASTRICFFTVAALVNCLEEMQKVRTGEAEAIPPGVPKQTNQWSSRMLAACDA